MFAQTDDTILFTWAESLKKRNPPKRTCCEKREKRKFPRPKKEQAAFRSESKAPVTGFKSYKGREHGGRNLTERLKESGTRTIDLGHDC